MAEAADKASRVDIGFSGGQVLALRVKKDEYGKLRSALEDSRGERWHEVKTEDSDVSVDLAQVVYIRLDTEQHRVGF
jgi:hypothetical protein